MDAVEELTPEHPQALQPPGTCVPLKPHQKTLLHRCLIYERQILNLHDLFPSIRSQVKPGDTLRTQVGIIGDCAGAGKSLVVLSLICSGPVGDTLPTIRTFGANDVHVTQVPEPVPVRTNLIVVPHSLAGQWQALIKGFAPHLSVLFIQSMRTLQAALDADPNSVDIICCTCTYYNRFIRQVSQRHTRFNRAFFDEVDNMNVPGCVKPDALFTWFVTASYANLLHPKGVSTWNSRLNRHVLKATGIRSIGFIRTLFMNLEYSMPSHLLKLLVLKNQNAYVHACMPFMDVAHQTVRCRMPQTINLLSGHVDRMLTMYLQAKNTAAAAQLIHPLNRGSEDQVVASLTDKYRRALQVIEARRLYQDSSGLLQRVTTASTASAVAAVTTASAVVTAASAAVTAASAVVTAVDNIDHELRRGNIERQIRAITRRVQEALMCNICFEALDLKTVVPCCANSFCLQCVGTWLTHKHECPMCKASLHVGDLMLVSAQAPEGALGSSSEASEGKTSEQFSKAKNLEILVRNRAPDDRFLIFSACDRNLSNVGSVLDANNIAYSYLKGNQHQTTAILRKYAEGQVRVLLVSPLNYGCGVNMEKTTDIIMLQMFDTEIEQQVIGRAQRAGRSAPLRVWYLLYDTEMPAPRSSEAA